MREAPTLPTIGSEAFWAFYDEFCQPAHLKELIDKGASNYNHRMCAIMVEAHKSKLIHKLSRPERGWENHKAWVALRDAPIRNRDGNPSTYMRVGDVVVVEWGWDRDVIITHNPIERNLVSGFLLSGTWEEMIGLFLPLFERRTILECVRLRIAKNMKEAIQLAEEESRDWRWY